MTDLCTIFPCRAEARKKGLSGLEFAHGIPGTLGGAVCMNAGAYGGEIKDVVASVTLLDPEAGIRTLKGEEMQFSYRRSLLSEHPEYVVLSATFRLERGDSSRLHLSMKRPTSLATTTSCSWTS